METTPEPEIVKPKRSQKGIPKNKKPDIDGRIGKYFLAVKTGKAKTKDEAALMAGYPGTSHTTRIEQSKTFQALERKYYKDELLALISMQEVAVEHRKNIVQDEDKGAKNKAIEMALNKLEPDKVQDTGEDRVMVILKS